MGFMERRQSATLASTSGLQGLFGEVKSSSEVDMSACKACFRPEGHSHAGGSALHVPLNKVALH